MKFAKLRWWGMICTMAAASYVAIRNGGIGFLWNADQTHITLGMLGIFVFVSAFIGWLTLTLKYDNVDNPVRKEYVDSCWFVSDSLMRLGIVTTVLGFILMFNGKLVGLDLSNIESVRQLVVQLSGGLTTALTGTLVGVVTSMLTGAQIKNYEIGVKEQEDEEG